MKEELGDRLNWLGKSTGRQRWRRLQAGKGGGRLRQAGMVVEGGNGTAEQW
jgi:hypothetical protein